MKKKAYHLILILCLLVYQNGKACFCISEEIETANYSAYEELFLGKVLNIKRIEVVETYEEEEYELVGTITTFEVIKKWKGSNKRIVEIYQQRNSCGIDFLITNSRWVISAYSKSFVTDAFREKYPNKYLQTDNCSLYIEELDYDQFEKDIDRIDAIIPNEIELKGSPIYWKSVVILFFTTVVSFVILKRRKRTANTA